MFALILIVLIIVLAFVGGFWLRGTKAGAFLADWVRRVDEGSPEP